MFANSDWNKINNNEKKSEMLKYVLKHPSEQTNKEQIDELKKYVIKEESNKIYSEDFYANFIYNPELKKEKKNLKTTAQLKIWKSSSICIN